MGGNDYHNHTRNISKKHRWNWGDCPKTLVTRHSHRLRPFQRFQPFHDIPTGFDVPLFLRPASCWVCVVSWWYWGHLHTLWDKHWWRRIRRSEPRPSMVWPWFDGDWSKLGSSVSSRTLGERAVSHVTGSPGIPSHGLLHMFTGAPRWFIGEEHSIEQSGNNL